MFLFSFSLWSVSRETSELESVLENVSRETSEQKTVFSIWVGFSLGALCYANTSPVVACPDLNSVFKVQEWHRKRQA